MSIFHSSIPPSHVEPKSASRPNQSIILVSVYEIIKGGFALIFALMVFLWHDKLPSLVAQFTYILHQLLGSLLAAQIDNLNHLASVANSNWQKAFAMVVGYALLRFIEAYGLYKDKTWAYWYSVLGYAIFVPVELYYLVVKPFDWVHLAVFLFNLVVVVIVYRNMQQKGLIGSA